MHTKTLMTCDGLSIAGMQVPPFELHSGELLCWHMPCWSDSQAFEDLLGAITGKVVVQSLRVAGKVCWAEPARGVDGLWRFLFRPRSADWLRRATGMSRSSALATVEQLALKPEWRLDSLAGTPKLLLALEAAAANGADVIVYSSAGLDPQGRHKAYQSIQAKLARCAAIQICFRDIHGRYFEECHPQGRCLQLSEHLPTVSHYAP